MVSSSFRSLGQAGVRGEIDGTVIYFDPYLTDHVFEVERADDLHRMVPAPFGPDRVRDADFILVSHVHLDHCDPTTLGPMAASSERSTIFCPNACRSVLLEAGIPEHRIRAAPESSPVELKPGLTLEAVPAAHPQVDRDDSGALCFVGYVLTSNGRRYYHAGDTSPSEELISAVRAGGPIDLAMLPVNERNYYRDRRGIIGNMSIREAFQLAIDIEARAVMPIHWDMFAPNLAYPEEIELLYRLIRPSFDLVMQDEVLVP